MRRAHDAVGLVPIRLGLHLTTPIFRFHFGSNGDVLII